MKEVLREIYEYKGKEYTIRVKPAEADDKKYIPIIDDRKGYLQSTANSACVVYMCDTPNEALQKGKEIIKTVVNQVGFL